MYDKNNIFAKIINGDISTDIIYEDDFVLAINDVAPVAPIHILIIPKSDFTDYTDFISNASSEYIQHFFKTVVKITDIIGISNDYRLITNIGRKAGQSVFHFHMHIVSGKILDNLI